MACFLLHYLSYLLLLLLPISTTGQNASLGESLVAGNGKSSWKSPSGEFAFGFQEIETGNFSLAIYFNKIPERAVVWSANGKNPVPRGSKVQLTVDGRLVLTDPTGKEVWNPDTAGASVSYASMLDSGNFVLADQDSVPLWQSFDHPVDTILPTKILNQGRTRQPIVSFNPPNIWMITEETDCGTCGLNGYCIMGNDQRPACECPQGYVFLDPNNPMKGCKQSFLSQNCDDPNQEVDNFDFEEMPNTDWPICDYAHSIGVSEDWCRQACLGDCFCAVAIFRNGECWKKKIPLSNGKMSPSVGGKALIKIRTDNNSTYNPEDADSTKKDHSTLLFVVSVLLSSSVFLNFLLLLGTFLLVFIFVSRKGNMNQMDTHVPGMNLRSFTYSELEKATNGFKEQLGRGAFATVYKGILALENKACIAVKVLENIVSEEDKEFRAEVSAIGQTNHKNLVKLLGFCNEGQHRLLVYEFISNGTLADFLFRNPKPSWYQRMQIAFGTARGLFYLHEECTTQIIHCDIKPQNILLDDTFTARISDFGLAKILKADQTRTATAIRGTRGFVAPEWFKSLPISTKVDVYSFGIMLLEIICCRKNFEQNIEIESQMILSDWAYNCHTDETLHLLVENDEEALHDMKRLKKYVMIAIWCIQEDPSLRPTMKKVTQMLEGVVEVSIPPHPYSFISSIYSI